MREAEKRLLMFLEALNEVTEVEVDTLTEVKKEAQD